MFASQFRILLFAAFLAAVCPSGGVAQDNDRAYLNKEIFVQFGGSFYTSNTGPGSTTLAGFPGGPFSVSQATRKSIFSKSGRGVLGARYWFRGNQALEFSFSYSPTKLAWVETFPDGLGSGESVVLQTFAENFAFSYVRRFGFRRRLQPFVAAGGGFGLFDQLTASGKPTREAKFVVNFGAGADVRLSRRFLARIEFRDFFSAQPTGGSLQAPGGATHNLVPSAGIVLRF